MAQVILKKSSVAARVPLTTDLAYGELALNYADGLLYYKKSDGTTVASVASRVVIPRTFTQTTATALTPDVSQYDQYNFTGLASGLTINAPVKNKYIVGNIFL